MNRKRFYSILCLAAMLLIFAIPASAADVPKPGVNYTACIRTKGWTKEVRNGVTCGTPDSGLRMQNLKVRLTKTTYGSVEYRCCVEGTGWETEWKKNNEISGKTSKRIEAVQIRLTDQLAENYDVLYRVYVPKLGWLGWAKNGDASGTRGYGYRIDAIEVKLRGKSKASSERGSFRDIEMRKTVCLDPGHSLRPASGREANGPGSGTMKAKDSGGATGRYTRLSEAVLNLNVGLKLKKELENRGYKVVMTRSTPTGAPSNIERANIANKANADIFVRIHANWDDASYVSGALMMNITRWNPYIRSKYTESRRLSDCIISAYTAATGMKKQSTQEIDTLTANNWAKMPTALIEMGFMSNYSDDTRMATAAFQTKMAQGIANGIDRYFGFK